MIILAWIVFVTVCLIVIAGLGWVFLSIVEEAINGGRDARMALTALGLLTLFVLFIWSGLTTGVLPE